MGQQPVPPRHRRPPRPKVPKLIVAALFSVAAGLLVVGRLEGPGEGRAAILGAGFLLAAILLGKERRRILGET